MTGLFRNRKALAFITATAACAALATVALAYPRSVSQPQLGSGWECSRVAFLTSCTPINRDRPVAQSLHVAPIAFRRT